MSGTKTTTGDELGKLTEIERHLLDQAEAKIEHGLQTYIEVGGALLEVKERKLYREHHRSMKDYMLDRWQITRTYGHRLMTGYRIARNLVLGEEGESEMLPMGNVWGDVGGRVIPPTERVARPLNVLTPAEQREVWRQLTETPEGIKIPTESEVQLAVAEYRRAHAPTPTLFTLSQVREMCVQAGRDPDAICGPEGDDEEDEDDDLEGDYNQPQEQGQPQNQGQQGQQRRGSGKGSQVTDVTAKARATAGKARRQKPRLSSSELVAKFLRPTNSVRLLAAKHLGQLREVLPAGTAAVSKIERGVSLMAEGLGELQELAGRS